MEITSVRPISPQFPAPSTDGSAQGTQAAPVPVPTSLPLPGDKSRTDSQAKDSQRVAAKLSDAVGTLNQAAGMVDRSLRFKIDDKTKEMMVSVIDNKTEKVIRQIPSQEVLDMVAKMKDYMGMVFDKKA
ncbi:MAG: flagellar protein FlaG [Candidatus Riflebacteria bacterium]|nr:flagellar protein FlaG [Candidatus Riflebacteria bacterium]